MKKAIAYVLAGVMMFEAAGLTASEQAQASVKGKLNVKSVTLATGKSVTLKVKGKGALEFIQEKDCECFFTW